MSLIVRKIERGKWMQNDILSGADISADAITNCMKTKNNSLSVWEVSRKDEVDDIVLVLASQSEHIETMDVIVLDRTTLISSGLHFKKPIVLHLLENFPKDIAISSNLLIFPSVFWLESLLMPSEITRSSAIPGAKSKILSTML